MVDFRQGKRGATSPSRERGRGPGKERDRFSGKSRKSRVIVGPLKKGEA